MLSTLSHIIDRKASNRVVTRLRALLRSNEFYLIPLALVIGVATGAIVTVMSLIAQVAHVLIYGIPIDVRLSANAWVNPIIALIAPACGGLILGVMEWLRRRWKIAAAVDPVEANALRGGRLSMRDSIVVSSQTLVSNGSGASVGLEAGYTQIGAGVASLLGQYLTLRRNDLRLIVGCGAAAAIAAAFGAPITGAFYACELIVGVYSVASAAPILAASLAGALTSQYLTGAPYSLEIQKVGAVGFEQYIALFVLALLVAGIGIVVMRASPAVERLFVRIPVWLRPAIGGVCVGAMAIVTPQVLAAGHGAMLLDLHREMAVGMIATIIVLKLAACLISLASGFRGGLFFASLFIGSLLGKLFAGLLAMVGLGVALDP
ncbi:MAG: chloride channel protein, partial [Bradyrhizobium sp.]|nr:chloride channel protein [Bradyrhizobium sp.]